MRVVTEEALLRGFFIRICRLSPLDPFPLLEITSVSLTRNKVSLTPYDFTPDATDGACVVYGTRGNGDLVVWPGQEAGRGGRVTM